MSSEVVHLRDGPHRDRRSFADISKLLGLACRAFVIELRIVHVHEHEWCELARDVGSLEGERPGWGH